jgi:RND family efflux transporter MFP subunit
VAVQDLSRLKIDRSKVAPRKRMPWGWLLAALLAAGAVVGGIKFQQRAPEVETVAVQLSYPSQSETILNATGYAVAQRKASLSSKATGRLEWLGVLEGSRVKKGDLLARLENGDVSALLAQSAANVKLAQANLQQGQAELLDAELAFKRAQQLLEQRFVAAASVDTARARLARAQAAIAGLRAAIGSAEAARQVAQVALNQTLIYAPFDGVILTKNANVGDNITPFSSAADSKGAVVTIADMETLEVEADVSESSLSKIRVDQPCEIQLDAYPDLRLAGVVARMVPTIDRAKATLLVKVRFVERDPRVLPDMSAKVAFLNRAMSAQEKKPLLTVPATAVQKIDGKSFVLVLRGDKLQQVALKPDAGREQVNVEGVLKLGDKVVLKPDPALHDGSVVRLANSKPAA